MSWNKVKGNFRKAFRNVGGTPEGGFGQLRNVLRHISEHIFHPELGEHLVRTDDKLHNVEFNSIYGKKQNGESSKEYNQKSRCPA